MPKQFNTCYLIEILSKYPELHWGPWLSCWSYNQARQTIRNEKRRQNSKGAGLEFRIATFDRRMK